MNVPVEWTESKQTRLRAVLVLLSAAGLVAVLIAAALGSSGLRAVFDTVQAFREAATNAAIGAAPWSWLAHPLATWTRQVLLAPHLFIPLGFILLAEWVIPARDQQRVLSPALVNDFVWYLADLGIFVVVSAWVAEALRQLYLQHLGFTTVRAGADLPAWLVFLLAVLISDFLGWLHHVVRHKVAVFWWFHTIHHSQRELNAWTDHRVHLGDKITARLITFVPATVLGVSPPEMLGYAMLATWHTRLYHANIRSNFGALRYVLVTPQSHRIHHSMRPEHRDVNFGVNFSVWDYVFGTQCRDYYSYPETGIEDASFPQERRWAEALSMRSFVAQQLYPFRLVARYLGAARPFGGRKRDPRTLTAPPDVEDAPRNG